MSSYPGDERAAWELAARTQSQLRHARTCPAYGNYQPPYEDCTCGAESDTAVSTPPEPRGLVAPTKRRELDSPLSMVRIHVEDLLLSLGEDIGREGLRETPARVAKFYTSFFNPEPVALTTFKNEGISEMIVQTAIPFYSLCEHHMVPFFGTAVVAYIPGERIVGLSKLARLVQYHASGLQNQERITSHVADALAALEPQGVGVLLKARHLCMEMRGIKVAGAYTITSDLRGALRDNASARAEFLSLAK